MANILRILYGGKNPNSLLKFLDQQCYKFSEGYRMNVFAIYHFRFSFFVIVNMKFKKEG